MISDSRGSRREGMLGNAVPQYFKRPRKNSILLFINRGREVRGCIRSTVQRQKAFWHRDDFKLDVWFIAKLDRGVKSLSGVGSVLIVCW